MIEPKTDYLFEVAWEVCNKVGGIYTVVKSKARLMNEKYKNYFLVGPYFDDKAKSDFEESAPPDDFKDIFHKLAGEGIKCYYGSWIIKGKPNAILIDFQGITDKKDEIKGKLWECGRIDTIKSAWDFEEPMIWSKAVSRLIEEFEKTKKEKKIVAHFHEWMAAIALLFLKQNNSKVATVYTTHATMLGRALAGSGRDLYAELNNINPEKEAYNSNVQDKFLTEKNCALSADVFTTVSEITSMEAEKILGRKADVLVLNGLEIDKFPTVEETSIKHITSRNKIREFINFHFFPHYAFNLSHTLIFFIVGRNEYKNKGIDLFIKSLGRLNDRLKKEVKEERNIAAFFWIPDATHGIKLEEIENKNYYSHIKNFVYHNSERILAKIVSDIISHGNLEKGYKFTEEFIQHSKKDIIRFKRNRIPLLCTHNINDEENNQTIRAFRENGLNNREEDRVKVIHYPAYLDINDGLINLDYYDVMAGCHLGVFPSYYEPWGYTPLECAALGVPSITSDLAGFGRFIEKKLNHDMEDGIFVLKRQNRNEDEVVNDFTDYLFKFSELDRQKRGKNKLNAKSIASCADWGVLIENYIKAHNLAISKKR